MVTLGPWVLMEGEFRRGALVLDDGVPVEFRPGEEGDEAVEGVVVPALANAHTHLGDAFIKDPPAGALKELVAPSDGYKHRRLREATEDEVARGMRGAMETAVSTGSTLAADFREGGVPGVRLLLQSCLGLPMRPLILGRPAEGAGEPEELRALLRVADGIGASGIGDIEYSVLESWSEAARHAGRLFAIHASEGEREDIDSILDLRPAFLVHMASATRGDLEACAEAGVPVAVCPRSNARFGLVPDLPAMIEAGVTLMLGTDNAMFHAPSLMEEMRYVLGLRWKGERLDPRDVFAMALAARKALSETSSLSVELDHPCDLAVLRKPPGEPGFADLIAAPGPSVAGGVHEGRLWEVGASRIVAREMLGD